MIKSVRYDQEFFSIDSNNIYAGLDKLGEQYPDFTNLFVSRLAGFGVAGTPRFDTSIRQFLTHKDYRALYDTVQIMYPHTKDLDKELAETFNNIQYFYPKEPLGPVYYFISGLNLWSAITIDSAIGVGLDMYLGRDFAPYNSVSIPAYELKNREQERIVIEVAKAIFEAKFPFEYEGKSLLEMILYKGKELYFVEQVCRTKSDALVVGYEPDQLAWCQDNREGVYYFFVKKELLYSKAWQDIMPFVNDGPTTSGMPMESPGNIGSWLGWDIVRSYISEHPGVSLPDLMSNTMPAQEFLQQAKYKP